MIVLWFVQLNTTVLLFRFCIWQDSRISLPVIAMTSRDRCGYIEDPSLDRTGTGGEVSTTKLSLVGAGLVSVPAAPGVGAALLLR